MVWCVVLQRTIYAMERVGIPASDQESIFRTVAAILNLGNISFGPGPEDSSVVAADAEAYLTATGEQQLPPRGVSMAALARSVSCVGQTFGYMHYMYTWPRIYHSWCRRTSCVSIQAAADTRVMCV